MRAFLFLLAVWLAIPAVAEAKTYGPLPVSTPMKMFLPSTCTNGPCPGTDTTLVADPTLNVVMWRMTGPATADTFAVLTGARGGVVNYDMPAALVAIWPEAATPVFHATRELDGEWLLDASGRPCQVDTTFFTGPDRTFPARSVPAAR